MVFIIPTHRVSWFDTDGREQVYRVSDTHLEAFISVLRFNRVTSFKVEPDKNPLGVVQEESK